VLALPVPVLVGLGAAVAAAAAAGSLLGGSPPSPGSAMTAVLALAFTPLAVLVLRRLPRHPLGRLMLAVGVTSALAAAAVSWSTLPAAAWLSQWLWLPAWALIPVILLLVPDGTLPSRRWWPLLAVLVAASAVVVGAVAAAAAVSAEPLLGGDRGGTTDATVAALGAVARAAFLVVGAGTAGVLAALVLRWRRADGTGRGQLACLLPAAVLLLAGVGLDAAGVPFAWVPAVVALPAGLTVAVLRYRLHDLDLHIHRGTVWAVLTGAAVAGYAGITALAGEVVADPRSPVPSLLAAAVVAALLLPAQAVAQRGVRRLLYGRRDEPYAVLAELGRALEAVRDPLEVLPRIAASVAATLRVPYVAVRVLDGDGEPGTVAEHGRWAGEPEAFPMVAHGAAVGELLVAPRTAGGRFSGAEARLLRDLAAQAALAAEAFRGALALRRARDRLVLAREEERRRLRRDLHDGVASALVGTRMLAEAARRSVPAGGSAPGLLDALATDLDGCTAEVRELIDGLRPAALDRGLEPALHGLAARFRGAGPDVELRVEGDLADLPAAVEVVAYRVVTEALTNVVKHAGATTARVRVRRDDRHLEVEVADDGHGTAAIPDAAHGVGLGSVRGRAEEIGGSYAFASGPTGTTLSVLLPVTG
jgi:signal transduction histidine kinase